MGVKKKFPTGVMLGELPKDRKLKNGEQVAWAGKTYLVDGWKQSYGRDRSKTTHQPGDKIHGYEKSVFQIPYVVGYGVYEFLGGYKIGQATHRYIGVANTVFELQDLLGVPRVKSAVTA